MAPHRCALQAKRLEELDRLYREEVVSRKRAHNALQDAKGKIRVYCRVRPLLEFEAAKHQVGVNFLHSGNKAATRTSQHTWQTHLVDRLQLQACK
jgi:phage gp36-like protein